MNFENVVITAITDAFTVHSEKGRHEKMKKRHSYGLSLCIDGQITYVQNGREFVSDKSAAVILPKGADYLIRRDKTGDFPLVNFDCLDFLCDTVTIIPLKNTEQLITDFKRMKKLFCFDGTKTQIFSIFYNMLYKLSSDNIPYELKKAMLLIETEYRSPDLTNKRLAQECKISEVYLRKLFRKHLGISPKQFVIDVRLEKAKQMLSEGTLNISELSEKCGFSNPYHFSRIFKEHTGVTPIEYRKNNLVHKI